MDDVFGARTPSELLTTVGCPACGVDVVSPSLSVPDLLDRHLRYCSWDPSSE